MTACLDLRNRSRSRLLSRGFQLTLGPLRRTWNSDYRPLIRIISSGRFQPRAPGNSLYILIMSSTVFWWPVYFSEPHPVILSQCLYSKMLSTPRFFNFIFTDNSVVNNSLKAPSSPSNLHCSRRTSNVWTCLVSIRTSKFNKILCHNRFRWRM